MTPLENSSHLGKLAVVVLWTVLLRRKMLTMASMQNSNIVLVNGFFSNLWLC